MSFAQRLDAAMKKRNLKQADVARDVRVSQPTVRDWLLGADPRLSLYQRVVAAYPEVADQPAEVAS